MAMDYKNLEDFVGFEFNGRHSAEFNLKRVSDGSRYQDSLIPTFSDYTTEFSGGEGTFYWGTDYKNKPISLNVAFDSITEKDLRQIKQWLSVKEPSKLRFDETPYKYYTCKISDEPQFNYICFMEDGKRIYKGEGTINFIAYYPYAKSYSRDINDFEDCININEWEESSGLTEKPNGQIIDYSNYTGKIIIKNHGDIPTNWNLELRKPLVCGAKIKFELCDMQGNSIGPYFVLTFKDGEEGTLEKEIFNSSGRFNIDTKKRMITYIRDTDLKSIPALFLLTEGNFFDLPAQEEEYSIKITNSTIEGISFLAVSEMRSTLDGSEVFEINYDYIYY